MTSLRNPAQDYDMNFSVEIKVQFLPVHVMKTYGQEEAQLHSLTLKTDGGG
jgi:hypothetical protein